MGDDLGKQAGFKRYTSLRIVANTGQTGWIVCEPYGYMYISKQAKRSHEDEDSNLPRHLQPIR